MGTCAKLIFAALSAMIFSSCATSAAVSPSRRGPEIFQVGEVEVRLYQDRDELVKNLPPFFALLDATRVGNMQVQVSGYFDRQTKRIYAINDARTVIHEFKHYLEPDWRHGIGSPLLSTHAVERAQDTSKPEELPGPRGDHLSKNLVADLAPQAETVASTGLTELH